MSLHGNGPVATPFPDQRRSAVDSQDLADLIAETQRVIRLPDFDRNLRAVEGEFGPIRQSPNGARLPAAMVADLYAGRDPRFAFRPALVTWRTDDEASTTDGDGRISLSTSVRDHWRSGTALGRALAINSLAHELSHTLSSRPEQLTMVFTDRGFKIGWLRGWPPVASYTIGSVAQCTFLEEQGARRGNLFDCLRKYGVGRFTTRGEGGRQSR